MKNGPNGVLTRLCVTQVGTKPKNRIYIILVKLLIKDPIVEEEYHVLDKIDEYYEY